MNILAKNSPSSEASNDLPPKHIHAEPAFALKTKFISQRPQGRRAEHIQHRIFVIADPPPSNRLKGITQPDTKNVR
jgi:hypothetical protein